MCYSWSDPKIGQGLILYRVCLKEYDWVSSHVHVQDIIIMKKEDQVQSWSSQCEKNEVKTDQHF
jgi:hypothetical protein